MGPRIGKYSEANKGKFTGSSFPIAILGTLILWFGWFGFNGGSNGALDDTVPLILVNTFLSAAAGLIASLLFGYLILKKIESHYIINGPLAGFPLNSMKVRLYDGSYHDVDSDQLSFELCQEGREHF